MSESSPLIPNEAHGIRRPQIILLMCALYFNVLLAALDTTVVTTLLGHIASELNALESVSWVATAYTVAYSAFQPLYGKFSDIYGRKSVSVFCTFVFALGCLMCGTAGGLQALVAGRFVSGIGAGGMLSMSTVTVSDYVSLRSRGIFQGVGNVSFGTGASLGGILGSWLTLIGGWRLAFNAQVPLALLSVGLQVWLMPSAKRQDEAGYGSVSEASEQPETDVRTSWARIDWVGSFSLVSALLLCMFAITTGGSQFPWGSYPVVLSFISSAALLVLFFQWETKYAVEPVVPIHILTHRTVLSACLANLFGSGFAFAFLYYTPILLQAVFAYTYTTVGHRIVVNFVGVAAGSLGSGIIMRRTGKYHTLGLVCGLVLILCPTALLLAPDSLLRSSWWQSLAFLLSGLGYASMLTITLLALIAAVDTGSHAVTTAAQYTFRGAGSSLGIAVAASLFQNTLAKQLAINVGTVSKEDRKVVERVLKSVEAVWDLPKKYRLPVIESYKVAGLSVQGLCLVLAVLALLCLGYMDEHDLAPR